MHKITNTTLQTAFASFGNLVSELASRSVAASAAPPLPVAPLDFIDRERKRKQMEDEVDRETSHLISLAMIRRQKELDRARDE
jgi:hypothetical protein